MCLEMCKCRFFALAVCPTDTHTHPHTRARARLLQREQRPPRPHDGEALSPRVGGGSDSMVSLVALPAATTSEGLYVGLKMQRLCGVRGQVIGVWDGKGTDGLGPLDLFLGCC